MAFIVVPARYNIYYNKTVDGICSCKKKTSQHIAAQGRWKRTKKMQYNKFI